MADPRNTVTFDGLGEYEAQTYLIDNSTITYDVTKANGSAMVGLAVTESTNKTVALTADGDAVVGRLIKVEADLKAVVQTGEFVKFPGGLSATLTLGTKIVGALGASSAKGYVRSAASGTAAELNKGIGAIRDATDTTAVIVDMG